MRKSWASISALVLTLVITSLMTACFEDRSSPAWEGHGYVTINPGALVPIRVIERQEFYARFPILRRVIENNGEFVILGYTEGNGDVVWVIGNPDSGKLTWRQAGTLAHEMAHVADIRYEGYYWAALEACSAGTFDMDCHHLGLLYLLSHGVKPAPTWSVPEVPEPLPPPQEMPK
jgi:hypothetical protein